MNKMPIYMYPLLTTDLIDEIKECIDSDPFTGSNQKREYYGPSARWFFSAIFEHIGLDRSDEIAIITTSDDTYVSICVTIPCFNYAKVSRLITDNTRVIILIHEYGYVIDDVACKIQEWQEKGIVVIEDCAHIAGIQVENRTVGAFGDYALYSLSKIIPGEAGGLLRCNENLKLVSMNINEIEKARKGLEAAQNFLPKQHFFNNRRHERYNKFKSCNWLQCYEPSAISCPYFTGLLLENNKIIIDDIDNIEWGATLNQKKVYIPTNPLVPLNTYDELINLLKMKLGV